MSSWFNNERNESNFVEAIGVAASSLKDFVELLREVFEYVKKQAKDQGRK